MSWDKTEGGDFGHSSRSENFIRGLNIELANERNLRATAEAEVERLNEYLDKIREKVRPGGIDGGYPYGATNFLGYEVFKIIEDWHKTQAEKEGQNG